MLVLHVANGRDAETLFLARVTSAMRQGEQPPVLPLWPFPGPRGRAPANTIAFAGRSTMVSPLHLKIWKAAVLSTLSHTAPPGVPERSFMLPGSGFPWRGAHSGPAGRHGQTPRTRPTHDIEVPPYFGMTELQSSQQVLHTL